MVDESFVDADLERDMELVLDIVVLGRSARNGANRKNRQPLAEMFVKADEKLGEYYVEIIEDELNVKKVTFTEYVHVHRLQLGAQLKTLGPKSQAAGSKSAICWQTLNGSAAKKELDETRHSDPDLSTGGSSWARRTCSSR